MSTDLTAPVELKCSIIRAEHLPGFEYAHFDYVVTDRDGVVVAEGTSSSPSWVKHDAGGYHTKRKFDEMFPGGWTVVFDF